LRGKQMRGFVLTLGFREAAKIDRRHRKRLGRSYDLEGPTVDGQEFCPQGLMAAKDFIQARLESPKIQRSADPNPAAKIINRTPRFELFQEPEPFLGERQRQRLIAGNTLNG
jgi:hypothetical protein